MLKIARNVERIVKENQSFLIASHVNPDPDAISSCLAMALYLKAQGKTVHVLSENESNPRYNFFPSIKLWKVCGPKTRVNYDVAIIVDCGDQQRIGIVERLLDAQKPIINIDHHITNTRFGSLNCVLPEASSTAEIIFDFLKALEFPLTKPIATLLYLGIMTDTGSFRYESTSAQTHQVAAELLRYGVPVGEMYHRVYEQVPLKDMQRFMAVIPDVQFLWNGRVACLALPAQITDKFSPEFDYKDKVFSLLRTIDAVQVMVILTEKDKQSTRVNFRAHYVDVARVASHFGGGGHKRASGCTIDVPMPKAQRLVLAQVRKSLLEV